MPGEVRGPDTGSTRPPERPPLAFSTSGRAAARTTADAHPDSDMPPRPEIDETPPPVTPTPIEKPWMLWVCVVAWIASFVVGLGAIALTLLHGGKVRGELVKKVHELKPSLSADEQKNVAENLLGASAIAGAVLVVLQLLFVLRLWQRHRRTRIVLTLLGLINIGVLWLFQDAIGESASLRGSNERLDALGHAVMIGIAIVTMFWRSVGRWLRHTPNLFGDEDEYAD